MREIRKQNTASVVLSTVLLHLFNMINNCVFVWTRLCGFSVFIIYL